MGTVIHLTIFFTMSCTVSDNREGILNNTDMDPSFTEFTFQLGRQKKKKRKLTNEIIVVVKWHKEHKAKIKNKVNNSYFSYYGQKWPFSGGNI